MINEAIQSGELPGEDCLTCRVSSSYFFLFFEPIPIFSYFKTKTSYFSYFLACEAKICNKIENGIAVIAKQSVMFFLELNHDTLTIWYQIDQCHFAYTVESPVPYLKLCGLLTQTSIFSTSHRLQINGRKAFHRTFFYILQ